MEDYKEVKFRIAEFQKVEKNGRILTDIVELQENYVIFKATVYRGNSIWAEGYSARSYQAQSPNFFEVAETVAIGRALSDAGFNLASEILKKNDDPFAQAICLEDGSKYLEVAFRVAWMRREHPDWVIRKDILQFNERFAIMHAKVLDETGNVLASGHAKRFYQDDEVRQYFLEAAETAAVGRALNLLGYNLPPEERSDRDEAIADAPRKAPQMPTPDMGQQIKQPESIHELFNNITEDGSFQDLGEFDAFAFAGPDPYPEEKPPVIPVHEIVPDSQTLAEPFVQEVSQAEIVENQKIRQPEPGYDPFNNIEFEDQINISDYLNNQPVNQLNYKNAAEKVIPFGQNAGKTIGEILNQPGGRDFLQVLANKYKGDPELSKAAQILLETA